MDTKLSTKDECAEAELIDTGDNNNQGDETRRRGKRDTDISRQRNISNTKYDVNNITEDFNSIAINDASVCANCGKEGSDVNNTCNKCKSVMYCNAACKKRHRHKHKKDCEEHQRLAADQELTRVAELHVGRSLSSQLKEKIDQLTCEKEAAELLEEALFEDPPPPDECPICLIPYNEGKESLFKSCCGKIICNGCIYAMKTSGGKDLCAYCREPAPANHEMELQRTRKCAEGGNAAAYNMLGGFYASGYKGVVPQDYQKANELWLRSGELGWAYGYYNLGLSYLDGKGVQVDVKKACMYWGLAAMKGHAGAHHNLGCMDNHVSNYHRAFKHFMFAASAGYESSLSWVQEGYKKGFVTKEEYSDTLRAYQKSCDVVESKEREKATRLFGNCWSDPHYNG